MQDSALETLPVLGQVDMEQWSLPAVAVVLSALDSFNPCAFFVLLFLLSLRIGRGSTCHPHDEDRYREAGVTGFSCQGEVQDEGRNRRLP